MARSIVFSVLVFSICIQAVSAQSENLIGSAKSLLENDELQAYHGWIKYLIFDVEVVSKRPDVDEAKALEKRDRLETWIQKIENDPKVIYSLRGVHEWAYESPADGSGQPFMINIPQDYDREKALPLFLNVHAYAGNHFDYYAGSDNLRGRFELSVLGRARGGGYLGLSRADVEHALEYVETHWKIDGDRIHISGESMGGHGTFRLGFLTPDRYASARPKCGFANDKPFGNLLTLPFYAIHSDDDPAVPILHSRGPLERLQEMGGQVVFDWTTGLGHAMWQYHEGNSRGEKWALQQVRPASKDVMHINYTALSGEAMGAWWAEIEEWGDEPKPAKFVLKASGNNILYAQLTNVNQLKIELDASPFDMTKPLQISVNGGVLLEFDSPLPESVYIARENEKWILANNTQKLDTRRHTPGGPNLLYNGEPLLIVYGTMGNSEENAAMHAAAVVASRSSIAAWQSPNGVTAPDGVDHNQNLYGNLIIKADSDVSRADVENSHLVLIGTERQNSVVASIADRLPVLLSDTEIAFIDGEHYAANGLGLGLVYYNPDTPEKLIFWVASNDSELYRENSPIPWQMALTHSFYANSAPGYDCLVLDAHDNAFVAARSFDSEWNWRPRSTDEKLISSSVDSYPAALEEMAKAMKHETASDFAFTSKPTKTQSRSVPFRAGVTRLSDYVSKYYYEPIAVMTFKGSVLLDLQERFAAKGESITPVPTKENIDPQKIYRMASNNANLGEAVGEWDLAPTEYRLTDVQLSTALERHFPTE